MKNHRVVVSRHGGPEVLQMAEEELPEPKAGELRVKVLAAGVSAYDLMFRRTGLLPGTPRPPFTLGEDIVGVVDKWGAEVAELEYASSIEVGRTVAGSTISLGVGGGYAEYVCLPAWEVVPVPDGVDPTAAVCIVVNYLTAHMAMHRTAKLKCGERILVHGAAGGVGTALLELGQLAGLEMYGTASKHNHACVLERGATPIDYHNENFVQRIRALTRGGVDAVFDPIGGSRQLWRSYRALRPGGRLIWFGVAASKRRGMRVIPMSLLMRGVLSLIPDDRRVLSPEVDNRSAKDNAWYRNTLTELLDLLAAGKINPLVARRFPLQEAAQAHELLEHGKYAGKVVLVAGG